MPGVVGAVSCPALPPLIWPVSKAPVVEVTVWATLSSLVTNTAAPGLTVNVLGENEKLLMTMVVAVDWDLPEGAVVVPLLLGEPCRLDDPALPEELGLPEEQAASPTAKATASAPVISRRCRAGCFMVESIITAHYKAGGGTG